MPISASIFRKLVKDSSSSFLLLLAHVKGLLNLSTLFITESPKKRILCFAKYKQILPGVCPGVCKICNPPK